LQSDLSPQRALLDAHISWPPLGSVEKCESFQ
jgi:hypothetical protein